MHQYISRTMGWAFSWTSPLSPRHYWLDDLPVRLHKVYQVGCDKFSAVGRQLAAKSSTTQPAVASL